MSWSGDHIFANKPPIEKETTNNLDFAYKKAEAVKLLKDHQFLINTLFLVTF